MASHLDRRFAIMLVWERRQLDDAIKSRNDSKTLQQHKRVEYLKDLISVRRSFVQNQRFDDESTRYFLRQQLECLRKLNAEMGGQRKRGRVVEKEKKLSGFDSFGSMKEEIEAIEREAEDEDMDVIVEKMQGLLRE